MRARARWHRGAVVAAVLCAVVGLIAPTAGAATRPAPDSAGTAVVPVSTRVPIYLDPTTHDTSVPARTAPAGRSARTASPATIQVTYHGFSTAAKAAFQQAIDIWSQTVVSSVPITVDATWSPLPPGVLGAAGPTTAAIDSPGALADTWYPIALANALAGDDLDPSESDITATFSNAFSDWYLGTDGNVPAGKIDFTSVVLHELGHGLGFVGFMDVQNGIGSWGASGDDPSIYDRFTLDALGPLVTSSSNNSSLLGFQLQDGDVQFAGPAADAANGGEHPRLYAPYPWQPGSSYAHLDEATYRAGNPNSLMTPVISFQESIHDPGPVTLGIFDDLGWQTRLRPPAAPALTRTAVGNGTAKLTWSTPTDAGSSPISGYTISRYDNGATTPAATTTAPASARAATVGGLVNGGHYRFAVAAVSAVGTGPSSALSSTLVPVDTTPFADSDSLTTRTLTDFLGRAPTAGEASTARGQLNGGTPIATVIDRVAHLPGAFGQIGTVARLYRTSFMHLPSTSSLSAWLARYRAGMSLKTMAYDFTAAVAFKQRYGAMSNDAFVQTAYRNVLGRPPTPLAALSWHIRLSHGYRRGDVMLALAQSAESQARQKPYIEVTNLDWGMLRRSASSAEAKAGAARLIAGTPTSALAAGIFSSAEYRRRF